LKGGEGIVTVQFAIVNIGALSMNKFWGETERVRLATATCVLLETGEQRLLVDPSPGPEELEPMLFDRAGLRPAEIDAVFLTHFHGDHHYGLALFEDATWMMAESGLQEWRARSPQESGLIERFISADGRLPAGVHLFPSPGHTFGHHGLLIDSRWGRLIVAGDAVMTQDFFDAEEGYHNCVDFDLATQTIRTIKEHADWVIPGHGNLIMCSG
jgi:glyoxylase-like metal-dependent hydrolase (beta-lactamase superfamily II)